MATASAMAWLNSSSGGGMSRCRAEVSAGAAMGRADLGDRVVAADDSDRLTAFDGIEQIRECRDASVAVMVFMRSCY